MELVLKKGSKVVGRLNYSLVNDKLISVNSTFVDNDYRGQGIADELMRDLIEIMKKNNYNCVPVCSYAVNWFDKNKEYQYLLYKK